MLVGARVGGCVGEEVLVADGVETLARSKAVGVKVIAVGDTVASWVDEQAASPIPSNRLDANSAATFKTFPISRECTRKMAILAKLQLYSPHPLPPWGEGGDSAKPRSRDERGNLPVPETQAGEGEPLSKH